MSTLIILIALIFGGLWFVYWAEHLDGRMVEVENMALSDRKKGYKSPRRYEDWYIKNPR